MSRRELKSLQVENTELTTGNRSGKTRQVMNGGTELADKVRSLGTELAEAREVITSKGGELEDLRSQINEARAESDQAQHEAAKKVRVLEQQLESEHVQAELALLRALENLRAEHQLAIHFTLEKGNGLQMTALSGGLRGSKRGLRLLVGPQSINCTN